MELKEYWKSLPWIEREDFLARCKKSLSVMRNIACGLHKPAPWLCIVIECESNGAVTCEELRSDVDWRYLRHLHLIRQERERHEKSE